MTLQATLDAAQSWLHNQPNIPAYLQALDRADPALIEGALTSPALRHLVGQTPGIFDGILGGEGLVASLASLALIH